MKQLSTLSRSKKQKKDPSKMGPFLAAYNNKLSAICRTYCTLIPSKHDWIPSCIFGQDHAKVYHSHRVTGFPAIRCFPGWFPSHASPMPMLVG